VKKLFLEFASLYSRKVADNEWSEKGMHGLDCGASNP